MYTFTNPVVTRIYGVHVDGYPFWGSDSFFPPVSSLEILARSLVRNRTRAFASEVRRVNHSAILSGRVHCIFFRQFRYTLNSW